VENGWQSLGAAFHPTRAGWCAVDLLISACLCVAAQVERLAGALFCVRHERVYAGDRYELVNRCDACE
jgi:hypothetical protein